MSDELEELRKNNDLIPLDDGELDLPADLAKNDLIPLDGRARPMMDAEEMDAALGRIDAAGEVDLGDGLHLVPYAGARKLGFLITKNGSSIANVAKLGPEDQAKIREFLRNPRMNDLIPTSDEIE